MMEYNVLNYLSYTNFQPHYRVDLQTVPLARVGEITRVARIKGNMPPAFRGSSLNQSASVGSSRFL